ncbi:hypothetical protein [Streptomyces sp. Tu 3180]|uniref:hypothetical protein n=1 Tax=Streptomyces sp. Tu 3180 TaxID=2682611 RepID=UPI00135B482F|nr:hypothetical protein [Streptomyces sp. Tu 3180]KAF3468518.1 hypothetical protein GL259_32385 [Streptomyces sp. Tu 3180]
MTRWPRTGPLRERSKDSDRAVCNGFHNDPDNTEATGKGRDSSGDAILEARYDQETGPDCSCV